MKFSRRFVLPLAALLLVAAAKKPELTVRFYVETNARDGAAFSAPVKLQSSPRQIFVSNVPVINEHDIVGIYPFTAADGTAGCMFKLDEHGRMALEGVSIDKRGSTMVATLCGRQVIDFLINDRVSDGVLVIPRGMAAVEILALTKKYPVIGKTTGKGFAPRPVAPAKLQ